MGKTFELTYPELMLENLNKQIIRLTSHCFANGYKMEELKIILKKLWTLQILANRYVIAVSGLQNVGKTTLMKLIYQIPDEYVPENQGRGEKIPVLITEDADLAEFKTFSIHITEVTDRTDGVAVNTKEISPDEFKAEALEPSADCIMLELKVPAKYFGGKEKSFILLPGIEEVKSEWQDLVRISLIGAAGCVFLFNSTEYSNIKNKEVIDSEIKKGFENAKPIFILSKSDQSNDENAGLKQTILNDFGLKDESDRVICTGLKNTDKWMKDFEISIKKYSRTTKVFRKRQIQSLSDILKQLDACLIAIHDEIFQEKIIDELSPGRHTVKKVSEAIKEATSDLKKKFDRALRSELNKHVNLSQRKITDLLLEKDFLDKLKEFFVGKSLKDQKELNEKIESAWNEYNPQEITYRATAQVINYRLDSNFKNISKSIADQYQKLLALSSGNSGSSTPPDNPDEMFMNDIAILTCINCQQKVNLSDKFERNLKYLPALCLTEILNEYYVENINKHYFTPTKTEDVKNTVDKSLSDAMSTIKENVIPIAALILGVDGAVDGKFDIPANLGNAFSAGGLGVLGWGAAGLAALYITVDTWQKINKYELDEKSLADDVIYHFRDQHYARTIEKYDDMMDDLNNYFTEKMHEYFHLDKNLVKKVALVKSLADVKNSTYQLKLMLPVIA